MAFIMKAILFDVISLEIILNDYVAVSSTEFKMTLQVSAIPIVILRHTTLLFSKGSSGVPDSPCNSTARICVSLWQTSAINFTWTGSWRVKLLRRMDFGRLFRIFRF